MNKYQIQAICQITRDIILLTFDKKIHFGQKPIIWKDALAIRVSGKSFHMWKPNSLTTLSPNVKWLNVKSLYIINHV